MTRVAINGFGRIGRLVARAILERPDCGLELVSVNDLADAKANAWLFSRDSVHGKYPGEVTTDGNDIIVDGKRIHVTAEKDPAKLPHKANGVEIALECTGFFTDRESAQKHIDAGARRVLISAPAKGVDLTVVYGVNDDKLTADMTFTPTRDTSRDEVNQILKAAADSERLKGILVYSDEPLVSVDIVHTSPSSTIDSLETAVIEGKLVRVVSWYDNEWGFSNRMVDTAVAMGKLG